jgi:DNA-binding transcriptional regulator GbsR (MarR family)
MSEPDARGLLDEQHDRAEASLEGDRSDLFDAFKVLGQMRTQVLYREVADVLDDGEALAEQAGESQRELTEHIQAAIDGDEEAIAAMHETLGEQREADREALDRLEAEGTDLEAMGEQMSVYSD